MLPLITVLGAATPGAVFYFCVSRVIFSAALMPLTNFSARLTVLRPMLCSFAMVSAVSPLIKSPFWAFDFLSPPTVIFCASYCRPIKYGFCSPIGLFNPQLNVYLVDFLFLKEFNQDMYSASISGLVLNFSRHSAASFENANNACCSCPCVDGGASFARLAIMV